MLCAISYIYIYTCIYIYMCVWACIKVHYAVCGTYDLVCSM